MPAATRPPAVRAPLARYATGRRAARSARLALRSVAFAVRRRTVAVALSTAEPAPRAKHAVPMGRVASARRRFALRDRTAVPPPTAAATPSIVARALRP